MDVETAALNLTRAEQRFDALKRDNANLHSLTLTEMYRSLPDRAVFEGLWQDQKVVIKLLMSQGQQQKTLDIYKMQSRIFASLKTASNRIPEILFHLPNEGLFVFEFIDGTGFDELLVNASRKEAETLYYSAGQWLRDFTKPTQKTSKVFRQKLVQRAQKYINRASEPKTIQLAQQLHSCLRLLAKNIGLSNIDRAIIHKDFYPRNLIHAGDIVYGIDMENTGRLFVFDDITRFLMGASGMQSRDHPLKYGVDEVFLSAFLSGYGIPQTNDTLHTLRFFIAKAVLDHLCTRNETLKQQQQFTQMAQQFIRMYGTV